MTINGTAQVDQKLINGTAQVYHILINESLYSYTRYNLLELLAGRLVNVGLKLLLINKC